MARASSDRARAGSAGAEPGRPKRVQASAEVVAVCISSGGVPKRPVAGAAVTPAGLVGDGHDHEKHCRPHRAVSILDLEVLEDLKAEGYPVAPGVVGENLTVRGLSVQRLSPGDRLHFQDGPVLELTEPRKPCFVLDEIHPTIQQAVVGRCGFLARVVDTGGFFPGQRVTVEVASGLQRPREKRLTD